MSEDSGELEISRPTTPVTALPETARPYRFTWDPSSRRPGPPSVSGTTTDGRGDYFATRFNDFHFNTSTTSLALGALPNEWSSSKHGFHAISTVLNNPHKTQAPPKAHSALPSVPPADLPRVKRKDFDPYLRAIAPEWEKLERSYAISEPGPSTPRASIYSLGHQVVSSLQQGKAMPPLEAVPPIFFEPNFDLGNPRTFAVVTEQDTNSDANPDPTSLSHSLPLLEKFSHYADTIEMHLTHEISVRSSSFFAALSNLHHLQAESVACLSQVTKLRNLLVEVDDDVAKRGMEVVRMETKMQNIKNIQEGVLGVKEMVEMTGIARDLVSGGQWGQALGLVEDLESMWAPKPVPVPQNGSEKDLFLRLHGDLSPIPATPEEDMEQLPLKHKQRLSFPLSSLHAFSALPAHLRSLTMEIASSLSTQFVSVLREDLSERTSGDGESKGKMKANEDIKERLNPLLEGLYRTKGFREASLSWREVVLGEIRSLVGGQFPSFSVEDQVNGSSTEPRPGLANYLRGSTHSEFMKNLRAIYMRLLNAIEGLQAQSTLVGELLESIQIMHQNPETSLKTELNDILSSAAELSHVQVARIVSLRSEQNAALPLSEFVEFFTESWNFVVKGEVICRRMIVGLRGVVVGQAKLFLQVFHQVRLTQSAKLVEDEQWSPNEVSPALQRTADILVDAAVHDSSELTLVVSSPHAHITTNGTPPMSPSAPSQPPSSQTSNSKHLRIEDRTYYSVPATSESLVLLLDYIKLIVNLSTLTMDTMSKIIEFLKAFNSRTCQVVLGAGAMKSAGLKNITAKHLALASQSLSIMIALIPYVRETFRRHLSQKQAVILVEFDKLKRDYQEHQNEIYAKLISIMGDRLTFHIKSLQAVDWSVPKPAGGINDYMEVLVKETVTLHKVLSRYLPPSVVEDVMTQVFAAINHRLSEEYAKIELPNEDAKARLLADAKYLRIKFSGLKNVGTPSAMLETVIKENSLPRSPSLQSPARANTIASPVATPLTKSISNSSTNERLKGLLSAKSSSFDKALPAPAPEAAPPPPPPLASPPINGNDTTVNGGHGETSSGFKQVELMAEPEPLLQDDQQNRQEEKVEKPLSEVTDMLTGTKTLGQESVESHANAS